MTWINRLKLAGGLLLVVALVAALTVVLTRRESQALSTSATVEVERFELGTDFAGTITEQFVDEGDSVAPGDRVLTLSSAELLTDAAPLVDTMAYTIGDAGEITLLATAAGRVADLTAPTGSFVRAGTPLVTVEQTGTRYVDAEFDLDPRDFARLSEGASVGLVLPSGERLTGAVESTQVTTVEGRAITRVVVSSDELRDNESLPLAQPGTPVEATLHLEGDEVLGGFTDAVTGFLQRIGL